MSKQGNHKLKILYLLQLLREHSDKTNPVTMEQILTRLKENGISAERKSIYSDIETLRKFGIRVVLRRSKPMGYYLEKEEGVQKNLSVKLHKPMTESNKSSGEVPLQSIELACSPRVAPAVKKQLGKGLEEAVDADGRCCLRARVTLTPQFFSWLFFLGMDAELLSPSEAIDEMKHQLEVVSGIYS